MSEQSQQIEEKKYPVAVSAKFAGGTLLASLPLDLLAHLGPTGLLVGGIASYVAWKHGPEIYDQMRDMIPALPPLDEPREKVEQNQSRGGRSLLDRALGRFPEGYQEQTNDLAQEEEWDEDWYEDDDEGASLPTSHGAMFTLSQLLAEGFTPSLRKIFVGRLIDGTDVFVEAKDLCHVALAGNTGGGKTSLMRMIMVQLCKVGVHVLLLNPHYMRYDRAANEDWTPFDTYLEKPPVECAKYANIKIYLQWMAETLLPRRMERARDGKAVGKPYFIVIDELPAIIKHVKEAAGYIADILREGRKYGIYLIVAAQDFLAKTVASDGEGAIRKMYRTALYVGGDATTAKTLLDMPANKIPETDLGKGTVMLRCATTKQAVIANVPYVDNESLYKLLGPSTFKRVAEEREPQEQLFSQVVQRLEDAGGSYTPTQIDALLALLTGPAEDERSIESELPENPRRTNLSVVRPPQGASGELPQGGVSEPVVRAECAPEGFQARGDDLLLSELQAELLKVFYRNCGSVGKSLEQIKNDKGQGLGGRYTRHASYILEQCGLKKARA